MQKIFLRVCFLLLFSAAADAQVGYGTITPHSSLDVRGALAVSLRAFTASTSATTADYTLIFTGTAAVTVTLPDAAGCAGRIYWIKNASTVLPAPVISITPVSAQTVNGLGGWTMDESNEVVRLVSDGVNWQVTTQDAVVRKTATVGGMWIQGGNRLTAIKNFGTTNNFNLPFITANAEAMRLTTAGYLGLGTANPVGRLHLVTDNDENGNDYIFNDYGTAISANLLLRKIRGTVAAPQNLQTGDLIAQFRFAGRYNGTLNKVGGSGFDAYYQGTGTSNSTDLHLFTSNAECMLINELGYTGIGSGAFAASPEKLLVDAGITDSYNVISARGEIDNYLQLNIQNRSGSNTASSDVVATADNGDETTGYIDMGINSSGYTNSLIPILNGASEAYLFAIGNNFVIGNGTPGYDMSLFSGGYALTNERIRITGAGNIGIGAITPADKLTIAGIVAPSANSLYSMGTSIARWTEVWSANGTVQTSDARLKNKIQTLEYGLNEIRQLAPVAYNWKDKPAIHKKIGLIAQDVQLLLPEVVVGDAKKEMLGINYPELIPVLVNAIKEQQQQLALLKKELALLESKID